MARNRVPRPSSALTVASRRSHRANHTLQTSSAGRTIENVSTCKIQDSRFKIQGAMGRMIDNVSTWGLCTSRLGSFVTAWV